MTKYLGKILLLITREADHLPNEFALLREENENQDFRTVSYYWLYLASYYRKR